MGSVEVEEKKEEKKEKDEAGKNEEEKRLDKQGLWIRETKTWDIRWLDRHCIHFWWCKDSVCALFLSTSLSLCVCSLLSSVPKESLFGSFYDNTRMNFIKRPQGTDCFPYATFLFFF